jgi:hypothetical protein
VHDKDGQVVAQGKIEDGNSRSNGGTVNDDDGVDDGGDDAVDAGGDGGWDDGSVDGGYGTFEDPGETGDGGSGCFVAGTPVLLPDGTFVPIEQVRVNDIVLSRTRRPALPRRAGSCDIGCIATIRRWSCT